MAKIKEGFSNTYEIDENVYITISYYITEKGYIYRVVDNKIKRISAQDYISALEYHYNY